MADFRLTSTKPQKLYIGSTEIKALCIGSTKIWEGDPWAALITQLKSMTPSFSYDDASYLGEMLYAMVEKGDYDGKAVVYWKDDVTPMACVLTSADYSIPSGYSGWTSIGTADIADGDNVADYIPANSSFIYLINTNEDATADIYRRSA